MSFPSPSIREINSRVYEILRRLTGGFVGFKRPIPSKLPATATPEQQTAKINEIIDYLEHVGNRLDGNG